MKRTVISKAASVTLSLSLALGLLAGALPVAANAPAQAGKKADNDAAIAELIKQLGNESFDVREQAANKLEKFGLAAKPQLNKATESSDPEISERAKKLLEKIGEGKTVLRTDSTWKSEAGSLNAAPMVIGSKVVLAKADGVVLALDVKTGEKAWQVEFLSPVIGDAAVDGDLAILTCADQTLYAVQLSSGLRLWRYKGGESLGLPGAAEGVVVVGDKTDLVCLDARNKGQVKWKTNIPAGVLGAPVIVKDKVYYVNAKGDLYSVDLPTGKTAIKIANIPDIRFGPVAGDGVFYFGVITGVYALDLAKKEPKWQVNTMDKTAPKAVRAANPFGGGGMPAQPMGNAGGANAAPRLVDGVLYIGSGGFLIALDAATGKQKWSFEPRPEDSDIFENVLGVVRIMRDADSGKGTFAPMARFVSAPTIHNGVAYFGSTDGLYAVDVANGQPVWKFYTVDPVCSAPVIADGTIFFGVCGNGGQTWDTTKTTPTPAGPRGPKMPNGLVPRMLTPPEVTQDAKPFYAMPVSPPAEEP